MIDAGKSFTVTNPIFYVDSIPTEREFFIWDTDKISRVNIVKTSFANLTHGKDQIHITSKNKGDYNFLSYSDLKEKYFRYTSKPVLLLINSIFVKNAAAINIDSSHIYNVEVDTGADFEELKNIFTSRTIVNIQTKNGDRSENYRPVMMHGMPQGLSRKSLY